MKIKIVSLVWYPRRNVAWFIKHGDKGMVVNEEDALTASQVPTHTEFKKVKPQPIQ